MVAIANYRSPRQHGQPLKQLSLGDVIFFLPTSKLFTALARALRYVINDTGTAPEALDRDDAVAARLANQPDTDSGVAQYASFPVASGGVKGGEETAAGSLPCEDIARRLLGTLPSYPSSNMPKAKRAKAKR